MYPQRKLALLAARKAGLRQSIARRRAQCVTEANQVTKPLKSLDLALAMWRRIPPLVKVAAIPVGLLVFQRVIFPRRKMKILGPLLRWGAVAFNAMGNSRKANKVLTETAPKYAEKIKTPPRLGRVSPHGKFFANQV